MDGLLATAWDEKAAVRPGHLVVCVDDETSILSSFLRLLRREPYMLLTTLNPFSVLDWVDRFDVSLVIADQRMPGITGVDLLKAVREHSQVTRVAIITGYTDNASIVERLQVGEIHRLIQKPWDDQELKQTILELLREREQLTEGDEWQRNDV